MLLAGSGKTEKPLDHILQDLKNGRDGDLNFRLLFERYRHPVHGFFQRQGIPVEDCRDLTQEVFLSVHRSLHELRDEEHFAAWLFTIARNTLRANWRRRSAQKRSAVEVAPGFKTLEREQPDLDNIPSERASDDLLAELLNKEKLETLIAALKDLPVQMRRCFHLRIAEDIGYAEIAAVMGLSINTVKVHIHNARHRLQQKLGRRLDEWGQ